MSWILIHDHANYIKENIPFVVQTMHFLTMNSSFCSFLWLWGMKRYPQKRVPQVFLFSRCHPSEFTNHWMVSRGLALVVIKHSLFLSIRDYGIFMIFFFGKKSYIRVYHRRITRTTCQEMTSNHNLLWKKLATTVIAFKIVHVEYS